MGNSTRIWPLGCTARSYDIEGIERPEVPRCLNNPAVDGVGIYKGARPIRPLDVCAWVPLVTGLLRGSSPRRGRACFFVHLPQVRYPLVRLPRRFRLGLVTSVLAVGTLLAAAPSDLAGQAPDEPPARASEDEREEREASVDATLSEAVPTAEELGLVPGRPRVTPTPTDSPPVIDGILDDEVWETAAHITAFTQQSPLDGASATEETDVYIAYDADHIYFGFHNHYEDPSIVRANRVDRDRAGQDDLMQVYLDTFLDQQRGYAFAVNGYGVQVDGIITAGRSGFGGGPGQPIPSGDRSWDTLFDTGGQIVEDGYTAEMAIPFKSLRYPTPPEGEPHRWGFQIVREIKGKDRENQVWAPMSRDETSFFSQMGVLEGMTDLTTSRNLEILPPSQRSSSARSTRPCPVSPTRPRTRTRE